MRVLCEKQGTKEWREARQGKITASVARLALGRPGTKGRANYIEQLANDIAGVPDFAMDEDPPWFADGRYYESWARGWYSWNQSVVVEETGFVVHDEYPWLGCSPDGLVGEDGMIEVKYRKSLRTWYEHKALGANAPVIAQAQTQLLVTGRRWNDYVNYWRSDDHELEKGSIKRIERDQAYIDDQLLPAFLALWRDVGELLTERQERYTAPRENGSNF